MATDIGVDMFDTVPLDRISTEAKKVNFRRGLLTVFAAILVAIGFSAAKVAHFAVTVLLTTLMAIGYSAAWCAAAVKLGWQEGQKSAVAREARTTA